MIDKIFCINSNSKQHTFFKILLHIYKAAEIRNQFSGPTSLHINYCVFHDFFTWHWQSTWFFVPAELRHPVLKTIPVGTLLLIVKVVQLITSILYLSSSLNITVFVIYWVTYFQLIFWFVYFWYYICPITGYRLKKVSLHSHFHIHYVHLLGQLSVCYTPAKPCQRAKGKSWREQLSTKTKMSQYTCLCLKPNYFKKQCSSSSFLLTWCKKYRSKKAMEYVAG